MSYQTSLARSPCILPPRTLGTVTRARAGQYGAGIPILCALSHGPVILPPFFTCCPLFGDFPLFRFAATESVSPLLVPFSSWFLVLGPLLIPYALLLHRSISTVYRCALNLLKKNWFCHLMLCDAPFLFSVARIKLH